MAVVPLKCPHCLAMTNLRVIGYAEKPIPVNKVIAEWVSLGCVCPGCHKPVGVLARPEHSQNNTDASHYRNSLNAIVSSSASIADVRLTFVEAWPKPAEPSIPEHLPEVTAKAFLQAERNFPLDGHEEAAGMMYRRALETGLAKAYPDLKGSLADSIKKLVSTKVLTEELGTWATQIRLIGNESAHGEEVTREDLIMARAFADAVLKYIFTLPEQVKMRSKPKDESPPT